MYFKIVERFGPGMRDGWDDYLQWRGLPLTRFDSVDAMLRRDLFEPTSPEDWKECAADEGKPNLIKSLDYAKSILSRYENAEIVGVETDIGAGHRVAQGILGYDVVDGYGGISLLTNWGTDKDSLMASAIGSNGLVAELRQALSIRNTFRERFEEDAHAQDCEVWSVYDVGSM